jgi:hypothetical protein
MKTAPFLVAGLLGCQSITGPDPAGIIEAEFAIAQAKVAKGYTIRAWGVSVGDFNWEKSYGPMLCGGELANGCFSTSGTITWNVYMPSVISHEGGHAILWKLGKDWECFEHGC